MRWRGRSFLPQLRGQGGLRKSLSMWRATLSLILTVALLTTSIGSAAARGAAPGVDRVVICIGLHTATLYVDAEGAPTRAPHLCPDCVLHLMAPPAPCPDVACPVMMSGALEHSVVTQWHVPRHSLPVTSRGPPILFV